LGQFSKVRPIFYRPEKYLIEKYLTNKDARVLEAGCGAGRISFNIEKYGYKNIDAFDFSEFMVERAKNVQLELDSKINFFIANAVDLINIKSNQYDYAIYLQQIISFTPYPENLKALEESFRILKQNGYILFYFNCYEGRKYNQLLSLILSFLRLFRRENLSNQSLPWLKLGGKFNWELLRKNQPTIYWFRKKEIITIIEKIDYAIVEVLNPGTLFIVCRK